MSESCVIMSGKEVSACLRENMKEEVAVFKEKYGRTPSLAVILVGEDPASAVYVKNKHKACEEVGIRSISIKKCAETCEDEIIREIEALNRDENVDGILVQLPLPSHINVERVTETILPEKDVDAFHPYNYGKIASGKFDLAPCTPSGIIEIFRHYNVDVAGKNCVIVGRSNIVGKPMAMLMLKENATVTICHSKTKDLNSFTQKADILIAAIGKPKFIKADMVKDGVIIADVGMNRTDEGKLCGDVDFEEVSKKASFITPVPGGVGPMTVTMLLTNTIKAANSIKN